MQEQEYTEEELEKFAEEKLDNLGVASAGCFTFNILTGGAGIVLVVILGVILAGFIYLKWFRGSINFSKLKSKFSRK